MESGDGLRTLECLRARLLAERQASKTAKQDVQLMGNKLTELEEKLKQETKLRNKAEKRLELLRKKLESLELLSTFDDSSHENADDTSSSSLKVSTMDDDYVDNSLALVPLILPETKLDPEIKMISKSIGEVLDTLRYARERIQSKMKRRQMIRVGPS